MRAMRTLIASALVCIAASAAPAQDRPVAFVNARILPIVGAPIDDGVVIIRNGKIETIGAKSVVRLAANLEVHDCAGKVLMPGLVDTHSHIGDVSGGDDSAALHPDVRVLDSIDVRDPSVMRARAGGITTVNLMPGSGLLMSGQTAYLKLRRPDGGGTLDDLLLRDDQGKPLGGMKMANGTNPRGDPPRPGTRAKAAALVREKFVAAQTYREKIARANGDAEKLPARDLNMEALGEVLDQKRVVHHHTHRADDVLTVLRLKQEFGFRVVLHHVSDGWRIADQIKAAGAPCSIIMVDSPGGKLEALNASWTTGGSLERAGVLIGFHTDDPITDSRLFLRSAALAVRAGMTRDGALFGLTMAGAVMLDLDRRVGSLEVGKDADLVVLSGDPLSVYTHVEETWIDGKRVFDRANPADRVFAVGGPGAGDPEAFDGCCFGPNGVGDQEDAR